MTPRFTDELAATSSDCASRAMRERGAERLGASVVVARAHARHAEREERRALPWRGRRGSRARSTSEDQQVDGVPGRTLSSVMARRCIASRRASRRRSRRRSAARLLGDADRSSVSPVRASVCTRSDRVCTMSARAAHALRRRQQLAAFDGRLARALSEPHARLEAAQLHGHRLRRLVREARRREDRVARAFHVAPSGPTARPRARSRRAPPRARRRWRRAAARGAGTPPPRPARTVPSRATRRGGTTRRPGPSCRCARSATRCDPPHRASRGRQHVGDPLVLDAAGAPGSPNAARRRSAAHARTDRCRRPARAPARSPTSRGRRRSRRAPRPCVTPAASASSGSGKVRPIAAAVTRIFIASGEQSRQTAPHQVRHARRQRERAGDGPRPRRCRRTRTRPPRPSCAAAA